MPLILSLETSTRNCSVALSRDGELLGIKELAEEKFSHAEKLHSFILEITEQASLTLHELDAIAVSKGPGSYTGLRIGVSSAKGLCFALNKPLISVPTLQSLAHKVTVEEGTVIIPLLDARRMEVYSAVFDADGEMIRETRAEVVGSDSFASYLDSGPVLFLGDGSEKIKEVVSHVNATFADVRYPSAREACVLAERKYREGEFEDVAYFEPYYLKDFIAGKPKKFF